MTMTLPSELVWVLDLLGSEWPEIDEDEVRRAAVLVRRLGDDLSASIARADRIIVEDIPAAFSAQASRAHADAWTENRSATMRPLVELLDPAATGVDLFADAVVAMKLTVIAELVLSAAQIAAAVASAAVTFGVGAAAQLLLVAARRRSLALLTELAIERLMMQMLEMVIDPLTVMGEQLVQAMLEAPLVAGAVGELEGLQADLTAMEEASAALDDAADDQDRVTEEFLAQLSSLQLSTAG